MKHLLIASEGIIIERVLSVREKEECLKGLKCLNKQLLVALSNELKLLWSRSYRVVLILS